MNDSKLDINGKSILITGGNGSLVKELTKKILDGILDSEFIQQALSSKKPVMML